MVGVSVKVIVKEGEVEVVQHSRMSRLYVWSPLSVPRNLGSEIGNGMK